MLIKPLRPFAIGLTCAALSASPAWSASWEPVTQIAASPTFAYDHEAASGNRLTLPLGIGLAKTTIIKGRPWKFQLQYWYYVEAPEAFGPRHQIRLAVLPVVQLPWQ